MKLILILVSLFYFENCIVSALRFDIRNPITVDHPDGVIEIGRPTKFTCAYMTSRSDRINAIRWYISYKNSNDNYGNVSIASATPPRMLEVLKQERFEGKAEAFFVTPFIVQSMLGYQWVMISNRVEVWVPITELYYVS